MISFGESHNNWVTRLRAILAARTALFRRELRYNGINMPRAATNGQSKAKADKFASGLL
jgi:hypothetical protein